jgi:hypothetical protein
MLRFMLGYMIGLASMTAAVGIAPTGEIEKVVKQYSQIGYSVVRELAGKKTGK